MVDPQTRPTFAVCVANDAADDLTTGMVYRVLPDESAARDGYVRVVDDSGEDYLYPAGRFVVVEVPRDEDSRLLAVVTAGAG